MRFKPQKKADWLEQMSDVLMSENGRWMIGTRHMIWGDRVAIFQDNFVIMDYCCAIDRNLLALTKVAVLRILERYPETITEKELLVIFPRWQARPINKDGCFKALMEMADFQTDADLLFV